MERFAFWSTEPADLMQRLQTSEQGLSSEAAQRRLPARSPGGLAQRRILHVIGLLAGQFKSPIMLILLLAAITSFFLGEASDGTIILVIIVASGLLGFFQEFSAANAVARLLSLVKVDARVLRGGAEVKVPLDSVVPGDVVLLSAGDAVPADSLLLESRDLHVDEAALTGESFPADKEEGVLPAEAPLAQRTNALFMGTHVVSGSARALAVLVGDNTEFGQVSQRLAKAPPETEFERGVRRFGYLLSEVTVFLTLGIFVINIILKRPTLDSFLFAVALAVGLTPQLLPAIISINLSHGARRMAAERVIVKRLAAIENFGSMNVLCSDKTGTLTEGVVKLHGALDAQGQESERVLQYAFLNASFESGFANPIDAAIREHKSFDLKECRKLDEIPYDFIRKRLSVLVDQGSERLMITKGALQNVLAVCTQAETADGGQTELAGMQAAIMQRFADLSADGIRVLGVAYRRLSGQERMGKADEAGMTFLGFLGFQDPPKASAVAAIQNLRQLGISLKVITGDNALVAASLSRQIGMPEARVLTGEELHHLTDEALPARLQSVDVLAEVEPNQKERIIQALRRGGNVVGFMGDGINDASALHAADVGISVNTAVDVAKDAADIVLLENDLGVLAQGVRAGRDTFANTLKYVFIATSANFGNMFSMAGASLFLPFLPLLPKQILLTNLLTDIPEMTIATDRVDPEMVEVPRRWDVRFIRNFMLTFGLVSSIFDYLTFGLLILVLHAGEAEFRSGWFVESVISAALIVLVVRTRRPFFRSPPGRALFWSTLAIAALTLALPYTALGRLFGFTPLPLFFLLCLALIVAGYVLLADVVKHYFYRRMR